MPDDLYWDDTLLWSEQQAQRLRRVAAGERVNDVDWEHVIEEIEDVGKTELRACESLLRQALRHLLKLHLMPDNDAAAHWRGEVRAFLADARHAFTPSMRQKIDLPDLYAESREIVGEGYPNRQPSRIPEDCVFGIEDLLAPHPDLDVLLAKLNP